MTYFLIILTVNIGALVLIYFLLRKRIDKKSDPEILLSGLEQEVEGLVTELNNTTERNLILLEQRIKDLKTIIELADKRASVLKKETQVNDKSRQTYEHLRQKASVSSDQVKKEKQDRKNKELSKTERAVQLYRAGQSLEEISKELEVTMGEIELMLSMAAEQS